MNGLKHYLSSSVGAKQMVGFTGILLILFVIFHLAGNLLIYLGPDVFNGYAATLHSLGLFLRLLEIGLASVFVLHLVFTARLVMANRKARLTRYEVYSPSEERSFAAKTMPYTGLLIFLFVLFHLFDFTLVDQSGSASIIRDVNFGLYGLVYQSFLNPIHSLVYLIAMAGLGLHLSHSIQSVFQTFGIAHARYRALTRICSMSVGVIVASLFGSIPIYIMIHSHFWAFLT